MLRASLRRAGSSRSENFWPPARGTERSESATHRARSATSRGSSAAHRGFARRSPSAAACPSAASRLRRDERFHRGAPRIDRGDERVAGRRKTEGVAPTGRLSGGRHVVVVDEKVSFPARGAPHPTGVAGTVEADEHVVELLLGVPPDREKAVQFP